jgi:hypothetical protein
MLLSEAIRILTFYSSGACVIAHLASIIALAKAAYNNSEKLRIAVPIRFHCSISASDVGSWRWTVWHIWQFSRMVIDHSP